MFHLPSYEECQNICRQTNDEIFYESKTIIDGFEISIFNYRLAQYQDFLNHNAFELRGLTFVHNSDGSVHRRFLLFDKFFNLNENESTLYDTIKDSQIKSVYIKEDGSIISFIKLPNGKVFAKSKTSFESEQAKLAQQIFDSDIVLNDFINDWLNNGFNPIFELVGPRNKIVLNYNQNQLRLIGLRSDDGNYHSIEPFDLVKSQKLDLTLKEMIELKSHISNQEGWVVEFSNGKRVKIKTDWYFNLHRIITDYSNREDYLIDMIITERIDDILSQLEYNSESRDFVEKVISTTKTNILDIRKDCQILFDSFDGDMKSFALKNHDHKYFNIVSRWIRGKNIDTLINDYILKITYRLNEARLWLWGE